jgi:hypothetical protein
VRTLLADVEGEASAGLLSAQAAPASDNETPMTPIALPRPLFFDVSFERAMKSSCCGNPCLYSKMDDTSQVKVNQHFALNKAAKNAATLEELVILTSYRDDRPSE